MSDQIVRATLDETLERLKEKIGDAYRKERLSEEWQKEQRGVQQVLSLIFSILPQQRYSPVDVLGIGGFSIVLRVKDSLFPSVDNALKFPRPLEGTAQLVADMIAKELTFLAALRHPGIVRMLYHRVIPNVMPYGNLPFYMMEVIEGDSSNKFFTNSQRTQDDLIRVVSRVADTIKYLHTASDGPYVHLDIKAQNISVTQGGDAILLDLGTCKRLGIDSEKTVLAVTNAVAHPDLVRMLKGDRGEEGQVGQVDRSEIQPVWDLWAFGRTILQWIGVQWETGEIEKGALAERLDPYVRKYLLLLCVRLVGKFPRVWVEEKVGLSPEFIREIPIETASQLVEEIGKLTGRYNPLSLVPELARASTGSIQAAPGVHVTNTLRLTKTLEHRLFRRLNSITQLGIVSQVFPGAKHARREHSLGTYGNVCRMLSHLYEDATSPLFRQLIQAQDICEILLVALLHDLGQFPLAHDLEDVHKAVFDHESLTQAMLKGEWRKAKAGSRRIIFEDLSPVFNLWNTTADRLIGILDAKAKSLNHTLRQKLLRSLISGPIDADKLDYLFRDARHTDVPYPNGIDVDRLLRCLTIVVISKVPGGAKDVPMIGVYAKGRIAAEFLTMARYAMFSQVYWHHTVRAQKAMLSRAIGALIANLNSARLNELRDDFIEMVWALPESMYRNQSSTAQLFEQTQEKQSTSDYIGIGTDLAATDAAVLTWLRDRLATEKLPEFELLQRILTRSLFKRLWVVGRASSDAKDWDRLCRLWESLSAKDRNLAAREFEAKIAARLVGTTVEVTVMRATDALGLVQQLTSAHAPWLLVDLPGGKAGLDIGLSYVSEVQSRKMRKDNRVLGDLQKSAVWEQYSRDLQTVVGNVRVFCDERLVETVEASIEQDQGFEDLLATLEAVASPLKTASQPRIRKKK
jgi:HD superfamily phosphohydrolase